jgi:hypothetical protein
MTLLIVFDALDECEKESDIRLIIQLLRDVRYVRSYPLRIFVTSRPDVPIRESLLCINKGEHQDFILHKIPEDVTSHDIPILLKHNFLSMQSKWMLSEDWPDQQVIKELIRKAAGLFIWAATTCRYIDEGGELFGRDRLSSILCEDTAESEADIALDEIYVKVLEGSADQRLKEREKSQAYEILRKALGAIVTLFSQLPSESLARLLHVARTKVDI